jgi:hypothetical protein
LFSKWQDLYLHVKDPVLNYENWWEGEGGLGSRHFLWFFWMDLVGGQEVTQASPTDTAAWEPVSAAADSIYRRSLKRF